MAVARYRQKLRNARKLNVPIMAAVFLIAGLANAWHTTHTRHDPPMRLDPYTLTVASQNIRSGRLPGFWLRDQSGERVRLANYEDKPLVLGFWSPTVMTSVRGLAALQKVHEKYGDRVNVIAICLSDDWRTGARFGRERGYEFPMLTDPGTHWADDISECSPLAEAYEVSTVPTNFIAEKDRKFRQMIETDGHLQWHMLDLALTQLFADQIQ